MIRSLSLMCLVAVMNSSVRSQDDGLAPLRNFEKAVRKAVTRADAAIASIIVSRDEKQSWQEFGKPDYVPEYYGTGIVIDHRLILTCYHVVRDAQKIQVRLPSLPDRRGIEGQPRDSRAEIYAADNRSDLAVLRLERQDIDTPAIELGKGEMVAKGDVVVGLSYSFAAGFRDDGPNASWGVISNLRRRLPGGGREDDRNRSIHFYGTLLQTDARIQLGGSGGALLDLNGKLVGITTAVAALTAQDSTGGYAIPIDAGVRRIIEVLRKGEEVEYGFLGVQTAQVPGWRPARPGGLLQAVSGNSPAERAGLRRGDIVLKVDGHPIRDPDDMFLYIGLGMAGREIVLLVQRGNSPPFEVKARLAKSMHGDFGIATNRPTPVHGLSVDYTSVLSRFNNEPMMDGVVVREVTKGTAAEQQKLSEMTDIITEVNKVAVHTPSEFYREAEKATGKNQPVRLTLTNPPRTVTLP